MKNQSWIQRGETCVANGRQGIITRIAYNTDGTINYVDVRVNGKSYAEAFAPNLIQPYTEPDFSKK